MINRVVLNETSYFGRGSRTKLEEELIKRGHRRILVVTDLTLIEANITKMVTDSLDKIDHIISFIKYLAFQAIPAII